MKIKIKRFNESQKDKYILEDDFADMKDISEMEYYDDENGCEFYINIDDESHIDIDEMLKTNNKINNFILTFKKCLKNTSLNIDYHFSSTNENFSVYFIIKDKPDNVLKISSKYVYVDLVKITKELKNINNNIHSVVIAERYHQENDYDPYLKNLNIYVLSGTTDDEYENIENYFNDIPSIIFDYEMGAKIINNKKYDILEVSIYGERNFKEK